MEEPKSELDALAHRTIGAAIEVHRVLGPGFIESVYEEALALEFDVLGIPYQRQVAAPVFYRDQQIGSHRLDLLIDQCLVVELKSAEALLPIHQAQLMSYLRVTKQPLGLLVNFNVPILKSGIKRIINTTR